MTNLKDRRQKLNEFIAAHAATYAADFAARVNVQRRILFVAVRENTAAGKLKRAEEAMNFYNANGYDSNPEPEFQRA